MSEGARLDVPVHDLIMYKNPNVLFRPFVRDIAYMWKKIFADKTSFFGSWTRLTKIYISFLEG